MARGTGNKCSVSGCDHFARAKGLCEMHYCRLNRHGDPLIQGAIKRPRKNAQTPICTVADCGKPVLAKGLCTAHYNRVRSNGTTDYVGKAKTRIAPDGTPLVCEVDGCGSAVKAYGMCQMHYVRWKKHGDASIVKQGGSPKTLTRFVDPEGYVYFYDSTHPESRKGGRVAEHRAVMMEMLGRPLQTGENVHHVNGNKADNRPENLELWIRTQPQGQRAKDLVEWAREILAQYEKLVR